MRPATARCLVARGVVEPSEAQGFIDPRLAALRPPSGLAGLSLAVERVADAVVRGERIGVFGDYDVDGITTAALLTSFLRAAGAQVECAVARRDAGYGFTQEAVTDFTEHRALIEQAKGILMMTYGIPADRAFDILVWRSQMTNTKLRKLASQLVEDFPAELHVPSGIRERADHLLLTAHQRVRAPAPPVGPRSDAC